MDFDGSNPWDVGGEMHRRLPWVQESMNYGWNTGNDFFQPKSKEQLRREAFLQLAVLAAVVVAPAVLGAAKAAGVKLGLGKASGTATGAEAPRAALNQGSLPPGAAPGALNKLTALGKAGLQMAGELLQPFADPQRGLALQAAAELGVEALQRKLAEEELRPPEQPGRSEALAAGAEKLLERVVDKLDGRADFRRLGDRVVREFERGRGDRAMARLRQHLRVRQALVPMVLEALEELGMETVWEGRQSNVLGTNPTSRFEINAQKVNTSEVLADGTRVTFVSGKSEDIELYQEMYEESGVLNFDDKIQIQTYFSSVYGVEPFGWAPRNEFRNEENRRRVIDAFENAAQQNGTPPSFLYTIACGEGLLFYYNKEEFDQAEEQNPGITFKLSVDSFFALGLDFFGDNVARYKKNGTLPRNFRSGGTKSVPRNRLFLSTDFPAGTHYFDLRNPDGSPRQRNESGGVVEIYPVMFRDIESAAMGASAVYATAYLEAQRKATDLKWGSLTENQQVFYSYFGVQHPYKSLDHYGNASANFLDGSVRYRKVKGSPHVPSKAYLRWVTWRYIKISGYFSR
ncbi:MAG: hypothetical protein AAF998_17485 [Bacteroidota bacterium]